VGVFALGNVRKECACVARVGNDRLSIFTAEEPRPKSALEFDGRRSGKAEVNGHKGFRSVSSIFSRG
jgi:hypothetical protein